MAVSYSSLGVRGRVRGRGSQEQNHTEAESKRCASDEQGILAEGAIALPVTLSGGALFAS